MGLDDGGHRGGERVEILGLGLQHLGGEDHVGVQEDPAEELGGERLVHPVSQPAGQHLLAVVLEVGRLG